MHGELFDGRCLWVLTVVDFRRRLGRRGGERRKFMLQLRWPGRVAGSPETTNCALPPGRALPPRPAWSRPHRLSSNHAASLGPHPLSSMQAELALQVVFGACDGWCTAYGQGYWRRDMIDKPSLRPTFPGAECSSWQLRPRSRPARPARIFRAAARAWRLRPHRADCGPQRTARARRPATQAQAPRA
jgi:hypothetical protein